MAIEHLRDLFKQCEPEVEKLVLTALDLEQQYISFELKTNSKNLKDLKLAIRQAIDATVGSEAAGEGDDNEA